MKKSLTILLFSIPFLLIAPMFYEHELIYGDYFKYMIFLVMLINTIISIIFAIQSEEKDERIFFILLGLSLFFYLIDNLFDIIALHGDYPLDIYNAISDLVGNIPILFLLIYRVVKDYRLTKKSERLMLFMGSLVSSSGFILLGIIALRVAFSVGIPISDIYLYLPFLIVDIAIMALLVTLYIYYIELNFRYYILALLSGYFFAFVGDVFELLYGLFEGVLNRIAARTATLFAFSLLMIVLIWTRGKKISISSLTQIEIEREKYKSLYLDLDDKVRDLLTLTQFLRHDFGNDIVVIANALEIYKEKPNEELLEMAERRLKRIEDRINTLRTQEEIYASLKTQPIPITFLEEIVKLFTNTSIRIKNRKTIIKGNQLLSSIFFNIIDNSFTHGGENVEVQVETRTVDDFVVIMIGDNGKGIPDSKKREILDYIHVFDESPTKPKNIGLSLAITTIKGLGGDLSIQDNEPSGTVIIVQIPEYKEDND